MKPELIGLVIGLAVGLAVRWVLWTYLPRLTKLKQGTIGGISIAASSLFMFAGFIIAKGGLTEYEDLAFIVLLVVLSYRSGLRYVDRLERRKKEKEEQAALRNQD